ncbi:MAG: hypothetical protein R3D88_04765 [Alphaproteobacteria bacterium]|jgi:hypothetical protein
MVTFEMVLLTAEMKQLGVKRNTSSSMWMILSHMRQERISDAKIIISKKDIWKYTTAKTLSISTNHLKSLHDNNFIELEIRKDDFVINIMPFLKRIDELQKLQDKRMKKLSSAA